MQKQLYRRLTTELQKRLPNASIPQVKNLALLTQTLVFSPNCHLNNLALAAPLEGRRESLTNRIYRFLGNQHITRVRHYFPLVRQLFANWPDREVNMIMDRTDIGQKKSILLLAVGFKYRAIPLTWRVLPFGGTNAGLQKQLLREIQPYLPQDKRIMFYADTEFRAVEVQQYCQDQHWGWQLGVKSDTLFHQGDERWQALQTLTVAQGSRRYVHHVTLTQKHAWSNVHLMVDWTYQGDHPRYVVCHRPTGRDTWRQGRKRFWIEPTFRDWKSYGFNLEASKIENDRHLDCLLLGMSIATLWLLHLGLWVRLNHRDDWLTANHRRDYSLFRLGRDYAQRSQICAWFLPICLQR
jgi:hypothetical protein